MLVLVLTLLIKLSLQKTPPSTPNSPVLIQERPAILLSFMPNPIAGQVAPFDQAQAEQNLALYQTSWGLKPGWLYNTHIYQEPLYLGRDGKLHPFGSPLALRSWYPTPPTIETISKERHGAIPVGSYIQTKPGRRLVRFRDTPQLYLETGERVLRPLSHETAQDLFGRDWDTEIEALSPAERMNLVIGQPLRSADGLSDRERGINLTPEAVISP